jgi:hypothetical protein
VVEGRLKDTPAGFMVKEFAPVTCEVLLSPVVVAKPL